MAHIQVSKVIQGSRSRVFEVLTQPENLHDLLRGDIYVEIINSLEKLSVGCEVKMAMTRYGVKQLVRLRVDDYLVGHRIMYHQVEGFFKTWSHIMKFENHGEGYTLVTDLVDYTLPLGLLGNISDDLFIKSDMTRLLQARLERAVELI